MAESDVEESFTFGSFTLEDTKEFKKNYNGLGQKVRGRLRRTCVLFAATGLMESKTILWSWLLGR